MVIRFAEQYNVVVCWLESLEGVSFASAAYATVPKHYYLQHELVKSAIEFALLMHSLVWFIHGHWIPVSVRHTLFAEGVGILVMLFLALISASRASFIGIAIMHFCWVCTCSCNCYIRLCQCLMLWHNVTAESCICNEGMQWYIVLIVCDQTSAATTNASNISVHGSRL